MKILYLLSIGLLINSISVSAQLQKGASSAERRAYQVGANFVNANTTISDEDIRQFCSCEYPIYQRNGISEIELRLQTACILGATECMHDKEKSNN